MEVVIRFLMGDVVVAAFAVAGDVLKPKSFAGLFGAAPSVAVATLGLTIAKDGSNYASAECRSMLAGAVALGIYGTRLCAAGSNPHRSATSEYGFHAHLVRRRVRIVVPVPALMPW